MTTDIMGKADLRVEAIVDPTLVPDIGLGKLVTNAVEGGATVVRYRDPEVDDETYEARAIQIRALLTDTRIAFLLTDRIKLVGAVGADGVHLSIAGGRAVDARRTLGPAAIVAQAVRKLSDANVVEGHLVDYAVIEGVFASRSRPDETGLNGIAGFRMIADLVHARRASLPVVAASGIDDTGASRLIAAGADGVAVASYFTFAEEPIPALQQLRRAVDRAFIQRRAERTP